MQSKTILKIENPTTQSTDSVKSLLSYVGRASDPLPSDVSLDNGRLVLILSNKKDCYYVTTARGCSCPSAAYRPGQRCKHQRKFFSAKATDNESIRPKMGSFKPVSLLPSEERCAMEA